MINRKDYEDYLLRLYFGDNNDLLAACINRAYLDFNRTIHGIDKIITKDRLYLETSDYIKESFSDIREGYVCIAQQEKFDVWHRSICSELSSYYNKHGYSTFSVGQAQKWINMTFKYIFTMGEDRIPGYRDLYEFCHIPLDNIILKKLTMQHAFPALACAWSRLNDYVEYLAYQKRIRQKFSEVPLDIEFKLWMDGNISDPNPRQIQRTNIDQQSPIMGSSMGATLVGPYPRTKIVICSADASPKSQLTHKGQAAYFFPGAPWVGAVRNAAHDLGCRFVILTSAHGMVNPDDVIDPYDLVANGNEQKVAEIWRDTVPTILERDKCDLLLFYAGGVPIDHYRKLLLPILRDLRIDFITFGRPMMFDSGKIQVITELLEKGCSLDELRSVLRCPKRLIFVSGRQTGLAMEVPRNEDPVEILSRDY